MAQDDSIDAFRDAWVAAFNSKDLDRHMALYRPEAVLFGSIAELVVGRDAIRGYFGRVPASVLVKRYGPLEVRAIGPYAVCTAAHLDFADGDTPMPYRMTWVLVRDGGSWQILQHHGSPRV
jgi:uncharacterized protein (TIGR02246 family)